MDATFTFPPQQPAVPRPSNATAGSTADLSRESEALRASVLDAALELGFGNNSLVSDWMFNDAADESYHEVRHVSLICIYWFRVLRRVLFNCYWGGQQSHGRAVILPLPLIVCRRHERHAPIINGVFYVVGIQSA